MQLIAAQAEKDGMDKDPDVAAQLALLRTQILADAAAQKYVKDNEPTDAELHAEYDRRRHHGQDRISRAPHPGADQGKGRASLIKKIKGGAKFEDVAKAESTDSSKANGGDLGWFTTARMVKPFGDAVKGLKKGEITAEPVQTQYGWHVIQLEDTRDVAAFDTAQAAAVSNALMQKKLQAYVEELKKNAKIEKKL